MLGCLSLTKLVKNAFLSTATWTLDMQLCEGFATVECNHTRPSSFLHLFLNLYVIYIMNVFLVQLDTKHAANSSEYFHSNQSHKKYFAENRVQGKLQHPKPDSPLIECFPYLYIYLCVCTHVYITGVYRKIWFWQICD